MEFSSFNRWINYRHILATIIFLDSCFYKIGNGYKFINPQGGFLIPNAKIGYEKRHKFFNRPRIAEFLNVAMAIVPEKSGRCHTVINMPRMRFGNYSLGER